jgi:MFS family permease
MITRQKGFLNRDLESYPTTSRRIWYLALAVAATVTLYYGAYALPSVAPLVLAYFHLTLAQYVAINLILSVLGAISAIFGSLSDRIGRANLVIYGVLLNSLLILSLALTRTVWLFFLLHFVGGFIEGIILVATPALVRDFSPRLGRATAMGFWTVGPVGGSLLATLVASQTLPIFKNSWQSQYIIAGIVGLVVAGICFLSLRDLSAPLRAQIMVSEKEKAVLEARARGIDVEASMKHPWKQMARIRVLGSAFGIAVFLLTYYVFVGYGPVLFTDIFKYSLPQANGLLAIYWIVDIAASVVGGIFSDRLRVRKPFMFLATIGTMAANVVFISRIGQTTSPVFMGTLLAISALVGPIAYVTWMAAFTEMLEEINPALVATGMAVQGSVLRVVVVLSTIGFLVVVASTSTSLFDPGKWAAWWWICLGGLVVFLLTVFINPGPWSPARAQAEIQARLREEGLVLESSPGAEMA